MRRQHNNLCRRRLAPLLALVSGICTIAASGLLAGCGEPKAAMKKSDADAIRQPLGQPMPAQAQAAMAAHGAGGGGAPAQANKNK